MGYFYAFSWTVINNEAVTCFLVRYSDRLVFLEDITLLKSQTYSVRKWAFDDGILHLQSVANLILAGE